MEDSFTGKKAVPEKLEELNKEIQTQKMDVFIEALRDETSYDLEALQEMHKEEIVEERTYGKEPFFFENLLVNCGGSVLLLQINPHKKLKYHYDFKVIGVASCDGRLLNYLQ